MIVGVPASLALIEEAPQEHRSRRVLELAQGLRLDLADALAQHRELLADLVEGMIAGGPDAEPHAQHAFLAGIERGEHAGGGVAQARLDCGVDRQDAFSSSMKSPRWASSSSPTGVSNDTG